MIKLEDDLHSEISKYYLKYFNETNEEKNTLQEELKQLKQLKAKNRLAF